MRLEALERERYQPVVACSHVVPEVMDAFRAAEGLAGPRLGSPSGLVDGETVDLNAAKRLP